MAAAMQLTTFPEALECNALDSEIGNRVALESKEASWTYKELASRVGRAVNVLRKEGVPKGARVALLLERNIHNTAILLGVMAGGYTACPIDPRLSAADIRERLGSAAIGWVIADSINANKARQLQCAQVLFLSELPNSESALHYPVTPEDDALMLFTSGSTGVPKAVLLTHANLFANAVGVSNRTEVSAEDRLLHAMPLFHTNGINNQLIVPILCGATVSLIDRFRAETFFQDMETWRPTYITGVPTMFSRLLPFKPTRAATSRLRFIRCGAAPLSDELHRLIEQHLEVPLVLSYGLSEATCTSAMNPPNMRKYGAVGTALHNQKLHIKDPVTGIALGHDKEGEVCISGPTVMKGYVPEQKDSVFYEHNCLRTGDLGKMDADGYLSIVGRLKDVIIRGGENISPGSIEAILSSHLSVQECVVVGGADHDLGEIPIAFVVLRKGERLDEQALKDEVREKLSRIHVPKHIYEIDSFPVNAIGKIDRKALKSRIDLA